MRVKKIPMSDEQLKYPQWQIALQDLIHELHREKINEKAHKVQGLIFERFQQLDKEGDAEAERLHVRKGRRELATFR